MRTVYSVITFVTAMCICGPSVAEPATTNSSKVTQKAGAKAGKKGAGGPVLRRSNRMEFDGRLVKGERASGAVYLFQRVPRRLPPLLKLKRDQLDRIVVPVLKRSADPAAAPIGEIGKTKQAAPAAKPKAAAGKKRRARKAKAKRKAKKRSRKRRSPKRRTKKKK